MIYFICPVFGRLEKTVAALDSIFEFIDDPFEVVIVDDHPSLNTMHKLNYDCVQVQVIKGTGSLYWGGGINKAISYLSTKKKLNQDDVVVMFNNDIVLEHPMSISSLVSKYSSSLIHPALKNQDYLRISAGSVIKSWFPFITKKDLSYYSNCFSVDYVEVDIASARFLIIPVCVCEVLPYIDSGLPHYNGDNDLVLSFKNRGVSTIVDFSNTVIVDETESGVKVNNKPNIRQFFNSFFSIRSPNCLRYRYRFVLKHCGRFMAPLVVFSMTIKAILAYIYFSLK